MHSPVLSHRQYRNSSENRKRTGCDYRSRGMYSSEKDRIDCTSACAADLVVNTRLEGCRRTYMSRAFNEAGVRLLR